MIYKRPSVDIIGDMILSMTFPVTIIKKTNNGDGTFILEVDNMYHAQPSFYVMIGTKKYLIRDIQPATNDVCGGCSNDIMVVKGDPITTDTFNMYPPYFFHGTPKAYVIETGQEGNEYKKTPSVWFEEQFTDSYDESPLSSIDREIKFTLFLTTQSNNELWLTDEAYKKAVKTMFRLAQLIIEKIKSMPELFDLRTLRYDIENFAKFGLFVPNKGMEKSLIPERGGVSIEFQPLAIWKGAIENCYPCHSGGSIGSGSGS